MVRVRGAFDTQLFLTKVGKGITKVRSPKKHTIFSQGDTAEAVFYIQTGKVKLTVVSKQGKEAVIAILEGGAFFGEACLAGQSLRTATATALEESDIVRVEKGVMLRGRLRLPLFPEIRYQEQRSRKPLLAGVE